MSGQFINSPYYLIYHLILSDTLPMPITLTYKRSVIENQIITMNFQNEKGELTPIKKEIRGQGDHGLDTVMCTSESVQEFGSPIVTAGGKMFYRSSTRQPGDSCRRSQTFSFGHVEDIGDTSSIAPPLLSSSCIELDFDSIHSMDESQLRSTLDEVIMENSKLKSEIEEKNRQVNKAKSQVKALLELETSLSHLSFNAGNNSQTAFPSFCEMISGNPKEDNDGKLDKSDVANVVDFEEGVRILPENTFVFIREMTSRIEVNHDVIRERMLEGLHVSNQILLGGATGWIAAYLLKNFGKTALTALGGGALILGFANRKGYVDVNWNEIYEELQKQSEQQQKSFRDENGTGEEEIDWTTEKIRHAKEWINSHSITVGGFACGFLYNIL